MPTHSLVSHGHTIEIEFRSFGAFAWLVAGFEVRVGGRRFHSKLDRVGFTTSTDFDFDAEGKRVSGQVRSLAPMWFIPKMRYAVLIEDKEVARGEQMLKRWYLSLIVACLIVVAVVFAFGGILALLVVSSRGFHI
jgi:hypothetical protein